jgi:CheY-like chemotaxis protein
LATRKASSRRRSAGSDTVIIDIGLPGIDGTKVIAWLDALAEPPRVLAITGQSHTMIRDFLGSSPSTELLRKPLSASELALYLYTGHACFVLVWRPYHAVCRRRNGVHSSRDTLNATICRIATKWLP